jgi:hypothetical protein
MAEIWKWVPGFEGLYEVSTHGQIKSYVKKIPKILSCGSSDGDYVLVRFFKDGKRYPKKVHQVVMETFVGPRPDDMEVRHRDGNCVNNNLTNLSYGTSSQNNYDRVLHGTHPNAVKTECPRGHQYTSENTKLGGPNNTWRWCIQCEKDRWR